MVIPPIKCQGIKSKLVPWIQSISSDVDYSTWVEPFCGSGVVAFNIKPKQAILCDSNPHIIAFYQAVQKGTINKSVVRSFLEYNGSILSSTEGKHYYDVRSRFNASSDPLDFLFLNRACFNGLIRFNSKHKFNTPFCRKPDRFAPAYITKICNQVDKVQHIIQNADYSFRHVDFTSSLTDLPSNSLIYADPPYLGRHVDYYDSWNKENDIALHDLLNNSSCHFILSTWHSNKYRHNECLKTTWDNFRVETKEHFYHVGAKESNRASVLEALVLNF